MHYPILGEDRLTMNEVAAELGLRPQRIHHWMTLGIGSVKLESFKLGGRRFTSRQALERFFARLNGDQPVDAGTAALEKAQQRERRAKAAVEELRRKLGR